MNQPIASMIWSGTPYDWYAFPILTVIAAILGVAYHWRFFVQWLNGLRGRNWPVVSATIDTVSVVEQRQAAGKRDIVYYLATLTYFYRNPELQTGDYSSLFGHDDEEEAKAWAESYKGSTVKIHVDPRDPSRSVLRKEEL
ncbi:MAG: DUF3592 domain-containing protein [Stellaceae bacterium]